jgi:hypothetical protein
MKLMVHTPFIQLWRRVGGKAKGVPKVPKIYAVLQLDLTTKAQSAPRNTKVFLAAALRAKERRLFPASVRDGVYHEGDEHPEEHERQKDEFGCSRQEADAGYEAGPLVFRGKFPEGDECKRNGEDVESEKDSWSECSPKDAENEQAPSQFRAYHRCRPAVSVAFIGCGREYVTQERFRLAMLWLGIF